MTWRAADGECQRTPIRGPEWMYCSLGAGESAGFDAINGAKMNTPLAIRIVYCECDGAPIRRYCRRPQRQRAAGRSVNLEARNLRQGTGRSQSAANPATATGRTAAAVQANQERFGAATGSGDT